MENSWPASSRESVPEHRVCCVTMVHVNIHAEGSLVYPWVQRSMFICFVHPTARKRTLSSTTTAIAPQYAWARYLLLPLKLARIFDIYATSWCRHSSFQFTKDDWGCALSKEETLFKKYCEDRGSQLLLVCCSNFSLY